MAGRDGDFPPQVKREIAAAAGHHCSMPDCRAPTSGPSQSQSSGEAKAGVAAHISAASPDGPRYDPEQTDEERQSINNAIWLCDVDARRIDTDASRFSRELLYAWRRSAEDRARAELGRPASLPSIQRRRLVPFALGVRSSDEVGPQLESFLIDIGAQQSWGAMFDPARMILHELALNAFEHGGAERVEIRSEEGTVTLRDDGTPYPLADLRSGGRGGHRALLDFEADAEGSFVLQAGTDEGENVWTLVDEVISHGANTPCGFGLSHPRSTIGTAAATRVEQLHECEEIHFYPERHWSYSDWFRFLIVVRGALGDRPMIIHGLSYDTRLAEAIAEQHPRIRFAD